MDRNLFLAILGSMLLVLGYNYYYQWRFGDFIEQQRLEEAAQQTMEEQQPSPLEKKPVPYDVSPVEGVSPGSDATETGPAPVAPAAVSEAKGKPIEPEKVEGTKFFTIKTGVTEIVLSNRGAVPVNYRLDEYHDTDGSPIDLLFNFEQYYSRMKAEGEDTTELAKAVVYPSLGIKFPKEGFSRKINGSLYFTSEQSSEIVLLEGDKPYVITFELLDSSGVKIRKTYTFYPGKYVYDFSVLVLSNPKWGEFDYSLVWFSLGEEKERGTAAAYSYHGPVAYVNNSNEIAVPESDDPQVTYRGEIDWAGLANHYYTAVGIPAEIENRVAVARYIDSVNFSMEWKLRAKLSDKPDNFTFFVGPKRHDILKEYENGMYAIINYGWFDFLAKPLFSLLNVFHNMSGNWGWAIIGLTCVIKIVFFPLSQKSFRSMKKMQKVQPHLKKIQETYKDDKEKLNQAMMSLYKEHKVNPLGGCMPMILQIPIFFSLYKVLLESIELKGAGWIFWITDLSEKDPYYITPVLMGASMVAQQLMTPKTGDKTQQYMMMALPVVFTFIFLSFPAGLVIYWLVNNILTIAQQWVIYREAK